ncbi:MAG: helix-turn-helix transcriptional regulator [Clostridia bacterium]|nr:helix-turn-helix transcriptional regulator [Clostridia bacterium]
MFINKARDGRNNVCGANIAHFRMQTKLSQRALADRMQLIGLDIDKNAIQRIECGKRFVTDIEILAFAQVFNVPLDALLRTNNIFSATL